MSNEDWPDRNTPRRDLWSRLDDGLDALGEAILKFPRAMAKSTKLGLAAVGVIAFSCFEVVNATMGGMKLFPDRDPRLMALLATGMMAGYLFLSRMHEEGKRERAKNPEKVSAAEISGFGSARLGLLIVILFAVFSNVASEALNAGSRSNENLDRRATIKTDIATKKTELVTMPNPIGLDADRQLLKAAEAEATGWGMSDLDPLGACKADLLDRQRQLCNTAAKLRELILRGEAMMEAREEKQAEITDLEHQLSTMSEDDKVAHYKAMSNLTSGALEWDDIASWGMLLISFIFLRVTSRLTDYIFEKLEVLDT